MLTKHLAAETPPLALLSQNSKDNSVMKTGMRIYKGRNISKPLHCTIVPFGVGY